MQMMDSIFFYKGRGKKYRDLYDTVKRADKGDVICKKLMELEIELGRLTPEMISFLRQRIAKDEKYKKNTAIENRQKLSDNKNVVAKDVPRTKSKKELRIEHYVAHPQLIKLVDLIKAENRKYHTLSIYCDKIICCSSEGKTVIDFQENGIPVFPYPNAFHSKKKDEFWTEPENHEIYFFACAINNHFENRFNIQERGKNMENHYLDDYEYYAIWYFDRIDMICEDLVPKW